MCRGAARRVTPASSATLQPPPRTPGRTQVPGRAGAARRGGGDTRQVAWGPLPYAPELPRLHGGTTDSGATRVRDSCPHHGRGGWGASEPFVQRGTALPGRAGCSAVCPVRRLLGITSPTGACCPEEQLAARGKGPRATSAQGWCLLCPPSRPCVPVFCTPRVRVALHCCGHRAQGLSLDTRTSARPGAPGHARLPGQVCWTELLWGNEGCVHPAVLGFFLFCGLVHSSTPKAARIV